MFDYWNLTPKQYEKYVSVYQKKRRLEIEEKDAINFNLGKYIAIAFHDPKKYPAKPFLYKEEEKKEKMMSIEQMQRIARLNTSRMGGTIK